MGPAPRLSSTVELTLLTGMGDLAPPSAIWWLGQGRDVPHPVAVGRAEAAPNQLWPREEWPGQHSRANPGGVGVSEPNPKA